jgi:hypothetical protein
VADWYRRVVVWMRGCCLGREVEVRAARKRVGGDRGTLPTTDTADVNARTHRKREKITPSGSP